jgi:hypothetical protein
MADSPAGFADADWNGDTGNHETCERTPQADDGWYCVDGHPTTPPLRVEEYGGVYSPHEIRFCPTCEAAREDRVALGEYGDEGGVIVTTALPA